MRASRLQHADTIHIQLNVLLPLGGDFGIEKDGFHGAFRYTRSAVNAIIGINVKLLFIAIETFTWADDHAIGVLTIDTGFGNDVSHIAP